MVIELEASAYIFLGSGSKVRGRLQFGGLLDSFEEIEARTQDGLELPLSTHQHALLHMSTHVTLNFCAQTLHGVYATVVTPV